GYFDARIWAAPATLANYALLGWFIGLGRAGRALALQLVLNLTNIVLDVVLVLGFDMGVSGVAFGTVLAEYTALAAGAVLAVRALAARGAQMRLVLVLDAARVRRTLAVNADIMIRSLALILVFVWFVAHGAAQGVIVLAANAVLLHFI